MQSQANFPRKTGTCSLLMMTNKENMSRTDIAKNLLGVDVLLRELSYQLFKAISCSRP